jgi:actin-related protein
LKQEKEQEEERKKAEEKKKQEEAKRKQLEEKEKEKEREKKKVHDMVCFFFPPPGINSSLIVLPLFLNVQGLNTTERRDRIKKDESADIRANLPVAEAKYDYTHPDSTSTEFFSFKTGDKFSVLLNSPDLKGRLWLFRRKMSRVFFPPPNSTFSFYFNFLSFFYLHIYLHFWLIFLFCLTARVDHCAEFKERERFCAWQLSDSGRSEITAR